MIAGPRSTDRGEFPNVNGAGFWKAAVLNQRASVRSLEGSSGSPTTFGRSGPAGNALVVFADVITVNTGPDCSVSSTPTRHLDNSAFTTGRSVNGSISYRTEATAWCGTSLAARPQSRSRRY